MKRHTERPDPRLVRRQEALRRGDLTAEQFEAAFTRLHGDLYIGRDGHLAPSQRIVVTVHSTPYEVVVGGVAAKVMHGGKWHDGDFAVELFRPPGSGNRPGRGREVHRADLTPSDVVHIDGIAVTSVMRTAFDLGRMAPDWRALGHLDDLHAATQFALDDLLAYASRFDGYRGIRRLRALIPLIDGRAESPPEGWVRLLMHRGDLPTPDLQVEVFDGDDIAFARIDLAYEHLKIAIEYDGEDFHSSPEQRAHDEQRDARLRALGWIIIRITADRLRTDPWGIVMEIERALRKRGGYF
ncbi:DUF559 domain-containing protein [Gordonia sp. OPL2]|nr:DUF559 domain-containing protein [Gordonia sp. OPL2]